MHEIAICVLRLRYVWILQYYADFCINEHVHLCMMDTFCFCEDNHWQSVGTTDSLNKMNVFLIFLRWNHAFKNQITTLQTQAKDKHVSREKKCSTFNYVLFVFLKFVRLVNKLRQKSTLIT